MMLLKSPLTFFFFLVRGDLNCSSSCIISFLGNAIYIIQVQDYHPPGAINSDLVRVSTALYLLSHKYKDKIETQLDAPFSNYFPYDLHPGITGHM